MIRDRHGFARRLGLIGGGLLVLGVFLALVKLIVVLAWHFAWVVAVVGLLLWLAAKVLLSGRHSRP